MEFVGIMTGAVALGKILWDKHEIYKRNKTIFLNLETCTGKSISVESRL